MEAHHEEREKHANALARLVSMYMVEHDVTIREMASRLGLSHSYVYKITMGRDYKGVPVEPKMDTLKVIAKTIGLTLTELLDYCGYLDEPNRNDEALRELIHVTPEKYRPLFREENKHYLDLVLRMYQENVEPSLVLAVLESVRRTRKEGSN